MLGGLYLDASFCALTVKSEHVKHHSRHISIGFNQDVGDPYLVINRLITKKN